MTKAHKWARERNGTKWRLLGIKQNLKGMSVNKSLTISERVQLDLALNNIGSIIHEWKDHNREAKANYLKKGGSK